MSHHQYNHYASGRPTSAQRQYDHSSMQSEREHRWGSNLGPGSSYSSSGASSSRVERSDRGIPSLLSQTVSYRPEQSRTSMDDIDERAVEIQISRAREEVKGYGKHQPTDQGTRFTTTQREEFHSTGREMHYPMSSSSASGQHRRSDVDSDGSAWTSSYERPASDNSEFYSSSAFKYASSGDSRHNTRREREGEMHSGAGSKDYDYAGREMPSVSTSESSIPKYSPQSAADILLFFGLEKEDLNELKSYPEDQLTPANLPFILRQIRIKKEKTAAGGQKNPYPDPRATTSGSGLESHGMSSSTAASHKGMSSSGVLQSKVIDYGHVSRYTGGITDEVGRTGDSGHDESGSMLLRDPYSHGRDQQEPLQKNRTEMKSAALGASHDQESSVTSQSSLYRSVLNSVDPQTRQLQPSQEVFSPYSLKDTGGGILKSKASKLAPSKELEADRPPTKTIQPAFKPTSKGHGMSPTVTGVVLFDSKNRDAKTQNKSQVKVPTGAEQFKKQQAQEQPQIQRQVQEQPQIHRQVQEQPQIHRQVQEQPQIHRQVQEQPQIHRQVQEQPQIHRQVQEQPQIHRQVQKQPQIQRQAQEQPQTQHQPVDQQLKLLQQQQPKVQQPNQPGFQPGQATWLPAFSSSRLVSHNPGLGASPAMGNPAFIPRGPPVVIPPSALPQMMNFGHPNVKMATSSGPSAEKVEASSSQPTLAMMYDYAATSPKSFPHTCSLCKTECIRMKDWIAHQNTVLHLTNCKLLRTRYPNWDGEITLGERVAKDDSKPSTSQDRHQREKHESSSRSRSRSGSRSRSNSSSHQHRYRGYESRRKGRSRSPYSSRYSRRSQSSSLERRSPRRRDDRHHLMRRRQSSPRRSHEWRYSPRRSEEFSPPRRSRERRWLSRRSEEFSPPRRSRERRWSSRRSEEQSPPRRSHERRRSPRRSEEQSPSRRRRDRRSSTEESSPQRISTTAEKLARKLLDNSEVKSLTQQSDLEAVVKTLAPALLAELVKMKPSPSTSREKKDSTSEMSQQKSKSNKSSPARTVRLGRIYSVLSHCDVNSALEEFGKTESLVLHRSTQQAVVLFEKEDDAEKLRMVPSFEVNGVEVHVMRDRETQPTDKKTPAKQKPSVVAASASKTATTGKIAAQPTADMDQKSQNTSKALITKAKKTGKAVKSGTQLPKAAEKEAVVSQKTPAESSSPDGKSEQTPETGNKKYEVVGKDTGLVSQSKDGTAVKAKPVLEAKIAKTQTPSDPSGSLDGTGSTASDDQPQTGDNEQKSLKMESEVDKLTEMDSTGKKPSPSRKLKTTSEKVKDETSMDATEPVRTSKDVKSDESGSAAIKEGSVTTEVVASGKTDDKQIEGQPAVSTAVTPSTQKGSINAQAASTYSTADAPLTVGEVIEKHLDIKQIVCLKWKTCQSQRFFQLGLKPMLITGLPEYHDGCYKMEDVVQLLVPFGFQHGDNNIYIVPQIRMAFVKMPTMESVHNLITKARGEERMTFKGAKISFHALGFDNPSSPYGFYTLLMRLMNFHVTDDGSSLVYIDNISLSESKDLRETLKKIGCVKNFLPLLNKLFIEFESVYDADRLGVWYSLLKKPPGHILHREKTPISSCTSPSPKLPEQALPDSTEAVTWATVPSIKSGIPQGSAAPFWIPLKSSPYLFPTISPWFNIPDYLTVTGMDSIKAARSHGSNIIMLTGLQESFYTHQNVAQLVWQYFPEPGIQTLYYNIIVLPLQRRAFVFFPDWTACSNFVQDHVSKPVSLNGNALSVHFVTEPMSLEFSEEMLYKTAMKLCNARVSEMEALEERLLCVEINEAAVHVTQIVLDVVASIAPFVSFLMLGNRICIEMAQPSGVTQVLEVYKSKTELLNQKQMFSDTVQRVENLKSFKQRLQDHGKLRITFECDLLSFDFPSPKNPKTEPPTCEMVENDSKLVLHSASDLPDVAMNEEGEKPGVEMGKDWGSAPETKDEIKERISAATLHSTADETSDISIEKRCNAPSSPSEEAAATHGRMAEEPQCGEMNRDILKVITETVCQPKLEKEMTMEEENTTQEEITDDMDQEDFNMDDFVTVDEVGADVEDIPAHSSSTSSTKRRKRTCSRASSSGKQKPTRSSNDSKGSSSSLSLSSSAPKLNEESCHSPKKPADSPEPNKSLDNPSVSDCRSKTSRETFPSSAKETGTGSDDSSVKVFIETQPEQHQEKLVDCAVVTSDHKEAAESSEAEKLPIHKQEEEQEDGENYQILDSFEEQTDGTLDDEDEHGSSLTQPIEPGVSVDEGKTPPGGNVDMSVDVSVPEDPAASALEDIQVQHGSLSVKQLSEGETNLVEKSNESAVGDEAIKDGESNKQNELEGSGKDQLPQDPKSPEKDEFEQEIFEILDTIDEATAPQDDNQTPNDQLEKHISCQKEGPTVSSQTESESDKDIRTRKRRTTSRKHDENSKKMGLTSTSEGESPLKQRMAKKYDTRRKVDTSAQRFKKDKEVTKEMELEEDAQNATTSGRPGRRRSARGKKDDKLTPTPTETSETPITDEETPYKVLDSVDEETPDDEAKVTRSTRGKRERANKNDALRTPARRRHTAAREAREESEKKLPEDQETPSTGGDVTGEVCHEDATYKILDSVEDEVVEESPAPTRPRKRGRPKKMVKTKKDKQPLKDDASEKLMKEEELYQVIDSVEDETADDQLVPGRPESSGTEEAPKTGDEQTGDGTSVTGSTKNQEEEQQEPPYQLVDSVITEAVSAETEDTSTCPTAAEASDSIAVTRVNETVSNLGVRGVSAAGEGSGTSNNSSRTERDQEDKPGTKSKTDPLKPEEESQLETPERNTLDTMVNLDEVSEEEENYPDDTAEEEELRKRPADSKEKHERKLRERPRTSTRAQRSRSQEDRGGDGSSRSMDEEREEQDEDSVEEDTKELLTLDEVGADEPEEERATESRDKDDITETELQSLVTLDEVVEEDDKMVEQNSAETHPLREEDQSVDFLNSETLVTIDEAGGEDKEEQEQKQKHSGKRKLDTETEENPNFVTLDEVGEEEEEKISPRARGRPRKRTRQTPVKVRRSVRGKNVTSKDEEEKEAASVQPATSPEKDESSLSTGSRREPQKTEVKAASAEPQPVNQKLEGCLEGERSRTDIKAANKQRRKLTGPEAKRACSQSPGVHSSFRLPALKPNNPLGQEFVVPTSGFFCNLCLVFYRNEKTAMEVHCSSQRHYDNLQKHYQKIEQKLSSSSAEKPRGGPTSD